MYFCPKSLCNERSYARHARYFATGDSLRSDTPPTVFYLAMLPGLYPALVVLIAKKLHSLLHRLLSKRV